jgi:hypothetical protein
MVSLPDGTSLNGYWRVRALLLRGLNRLTEAMEAVALAVADDPNDAYAQHLLGLLQQTVDIPATNNNDN